MQNTKYDISENVRLKKFYNEVTKCREKNTIIRKEDTAWA